jgi:YidC/Oxa1 family membrane protein insertase
VDRIQIAAIVIAIGIMLYLFASGQVGPGPAEAPSSPQVTERTAPPPPEPGASFAGAENDAAPVPKAPAVVTQHRTAILENDALRLQVSDAGGRLESIKLKQYEDRLGEGARPVELVTVTPERGTLLMFLGNDLFSGLESAPHEILTAGRREVVLRAERSGVRVTRTLTLDEVGYGARLRVRVENGAADRVEPVFQVAWYGQERARSAPDRFQNYGLLVSADGSLERAPLSSQNPLSCAGGGGGMDPEVIVAPIEWAGIESQYFMTVVIPENPQEASAYKGPIGDRAGGQTVIRYPPIEVPAGGYVERNYRLYMGPKVQKLVRSVDPRLDSAVRSGWAWVRPLVDLFVSLLSWTQSNVVGNYGVAIILLTILVRVVTAPLTQRSMKSMKGLSVIAPEMKELQEKFKDDRTRLQQEMMSLYRRKGINPLTAMGGGCLPMLIQMPFLLALYFALQSSIELRHAPFMLWIQDLSAPEDFFSVAGLPIRPLPLMMGLSMVLQQKLTPTSASADPSQRQMMMWMSVFFIFLFYSFPSGLVLYWFVSNLLAIAQQTLVNRSPDAKQQKK